MRTSAADLRDVRVMSADGGPADDGGDRRGTTRFTILIRAAKLVHGDDEYICVIRDASQSGVKLRLYNAVPSGVPLELELANGERFPVEQVWSREGFGGFRFPDKVPLERLVEVDRGRFPNRKLRLRTDITGTVHWGGANCAVTLENISQQGAAMNCDAHLAIDQLVRLETSALPPIYAKVRWRKAPQYGLVFEHTLTFEELARLAD